MSIITKIAKEAANQVVAETSAKKKKKKGMPSWLLAPAGLGAAAGLGGAYALGSDQHVKDVAEAIGKHGTPLESNETYLSRYADMLSPGANTKLLGQPVGDLLALGRSSPTILKAFGADPGYAASNPGSWHDARVHYSEFAKGPIAAYAHMMHPNKMMNRAEYFVDDGAGKKAPYPEVFNKKFQEAWNKFRNPETGYAGLRGNASWLEPHDVDTGIVPHKDQVKFLRDFHKDLPPDVRAIKERVENDPLGTKPDLEKNLKNYLPITKGVLKGRNILKNVGITSAGAGAGGLLGHYLHGALADEKNPSTLGYMASTLGGAGLGGAASYYGGTEQGRQQASNLIGKLMSMMQKKSNVSDKPGAPAPAALSAKPAPTVATSPEPQQGNWLSKLPTSQALVPLGGAALGGVLGNTMGGGDEDEEPNTFKKLLYTLGGVGAGGAAGYFGGTSQGRETMSNAYNSLFGKKQAAANRLHSLLSKKQAAANKLHSLLSKRADNEAPAAEAPAPAAAPAALPAPPKLRGPAVAPGGAKPVVAPPVKPDLNWAAEKWKVDRPTAMPNTMPNIPADPEAMLGHIKNMHLLQAWNNRMALGGISPGEAKDYRALNAATKDTDSARQAYAANPKDPKAAYTYSTAQNNYGALLDQLHTTRVAPNINEMGYIRKFNARVPVSSAGKPVYEKYGPGHQQYLNEAETNRLQELRGTGAFRVPLPQNAP